MWQLSSAGGPGPGDCALLEDDRNRSQSGQHRAPSAGLSGQPHEAVQREAMLTRPEHYFYRDPQNRYFACDLDGHCYKYMTRNAVHAGLQNCHRIKLAFGYVVEARKDQEMPEVMICSCELLTSQKGKHARSRQTDRSRNVIQGERTGTRQRQASVSSDKLAPTDMVAGGPPSTVAASVPLVGMA
eukprot:CAMPEP_0174731778 /NCGR_PEP_ID=MMETSP1094-20130205/58159_1 /TAXON_ID=156173 /ORGANISM="Chrysochromulina brevifilum, Strain UTEX LB 985" /LENGTH=184 /DNA_ID=CAMNT_0015934197 /DNA_START=113 /DNA_END=669 /DNA_ORIENTATION=-